jgi:hypothetical protein
MILGQAGEAGPSILTDPAHFRLAGQKAEGLIGGRVEPERHFEVPMHPEVLGLLAKVLIGRGPDEDSRFHPAALAGLGLPRNSFRLRAQYSGSTSIA